MRNSRGSEYIYGVDVCVMLLKLDVVQSTYLR
jgi:hypothetical protein